MLHPHSPRAVLGVLCAMLGGCTTVAPGPLPEDHPASIHAPAAPAQAEPSALSAYRDFGAAPATPPAADTPAMDHSMHEQHRQGAPPQKPDDQEGGHASRR